MGRKLTTKEFIEKAQIIHNNKYDYSKTVYIKSTEKVCIICPKHGEFLQLASSHLSGKGCVKCSRELNSKNQLGTIEEFIEKAKKIHGDKYNYSKSVYINSKTPITITCPIHGDFKQIPNTHLNNHGCPKCGTIKNGQALKSNTSTFIEKAKQIHNNKYDYSKTEYINSRTKVIITCPVHGDFEQLPSIHLRNHGCPKCGVLVNSKTTEQFIKDAKEVHGNKYDYSKSEYKGWNIPICIICPEHGEFWQLPSDHTSHMNGCPKCNKPKGEIVIENYLIQHNINFIAQYKINIDNTINKSGKAYIDFYLPNYNLFIEYNGDQHYEYVPHMHNGSILNFNKQQNRDQYIRDYCQNNNIKLIEIRYNRNAQEILNILENQLSNDN